MCKAGGDRLLKTCSCKCSKVLTALFSFLTIHVFIFAICLMFGSYYCLNIHCPVSLDSTIEFLGSQRWTQEISLIKNGEGHIKLGLICVNAKLVFVVQWLSFILFLYKWCCIFYLFIIFASALFKGIAFNSIMGVVGTTCHPEKWRGSYLFKQLAVFV